MPEMTEDPTITPKPFKKPVNPWRKFKNWLADHSPVICFTCQRLIFEKDAHYEWHSTGRRVPLCEDCHREIFNPFGGEP